MIQQQLSQHAVNVILSVASASTCSANTVAELAIIFAPESSASKLQIPCRNAFRPKKINATQTSQDQKSAKVSKRKPEAKILEDGPKKEEHLPLQSKIRLATEVINKSLKALTDVLRKASAQEKQSRERKLSETLSSAENGNTEPSNSLQVLCVDETSKGPSKSGLSAPSIGNSLGVLAIAQCACLAFAVLRKHDQQSVRKPAAAHLLLETGMSTFISKLIALGLEEMAMIELQILVQRLSAPGNDPGLSSSSSNQLKRSQKSGRIGDKAVQQNLVDMLGFCNTDKDSDTLFLVANSQLHVLKLMALKKRPKHLVGALEYLTPPKPYNPFEILDQLATLQTSGSIGKVVRQMELLFQALVSLCPNFSASEDEIATNSQNCASPQTVFQYHLLALQMRLKWWKLSDHSGNLERETLEFFTRALHTYVRRSPLSPITIYSTTKRSVERLHNLLDTFRMGFSTELATSAINWVDLYGYLSLLAEKSGQITEAVDWMTRTSEILAINNASEVATCTAACQMAKLRLYNQEFHNDTEGTLDALKIAAKALKGGLRSDSEALDELLMATASLRKATVSILLDASNTPRSRDRFSKSCAKLASVRSESLELFLLCLNFLMRYTAQISVSSSAELSLRNKRKFDLVTTITRPTIEAIASLSKSPIARESEVWTKIKIGLRDCTNLAGTLELGYAKDRVTLVEGNLKQLPFVVLSNAYWCRYLDGKEQQQDPEELKFDLLDSIDLLRKRPWVEQDAGFLHIKLERMACAHELTCNFSEALKFIAEALQITVNQDAMRRCVVSAASKPLHQVLEDSGSSSMICRKLSTYSRISQKAVSLKSRLVFDQDYLADEYRGILLEQQLVLLVKDLSGNAHSTITLTIIHALADSLLGIYDEQYPVRRLRVEVLLLHACSLAPTALRYSDLSGLNGVGDSHLTKFMGADIELRRFVPHLLTRRNAYFAMREAPLAIKFLQIIIDEWHSLIKSCEDWVTIQDRVESLPEWIGQLHSIGDLLHVQGFEIERVSLLRLVIALDELRPTRQTDTYILELSALGLQLSRLGQSAEAGDILNKAQLCIRKFNTPASVSFNWHLAYAEHLLGIGDILKCEQHAGKAERLLQEIHGSKLETTETTERMNKVWPDAELAYLLSSLALAQSKPSEALFYARRNVRLTYKAWALLECQKKARKVSAPEADKVEADLGRVSPSIDPSMVPPEAATAISKPHESLKGPMFWRLVPQLFSGLLHLSQRLAHEGLLPEAQYYADQATKVAVAVQARSLQAQVAIVSGNYCLCSGRCDEGLEHLKHAESLRLNQGHTSFTDVTLQVAFAKAFTSAGQLEDEQKAIQRANALFISLSAGAALKAGNIQEVLVEDLETKMECLTLGKDHGELPKQSAITKSATRVSDQPPLSIIASERVELTASVSLSSTRAQFLRDQAFNFLRRNRRNDTNAAAALLLEAGSLPCPAEESVQQSLGLARLFLRQALNHMASDPVFSLLHESATSCPSVSTIERQKGKDHLDLPPKKMAYYPKSTRVRMAKPKAGTSQHGSRMHAFDVLLHKSLDTINQVYILAQTASSTSLLHTFSSVFAEILMIISAICITGSKLHATPVCAVHAMELGRSIAALKETAAIKVERLLESRSNGMAEIQPKTCRGFKDLSYAAIDPATFQENYIDIIPHSWTVISISVGDSHEDIRITKLRAGQVPFIVVIPLNRHNDRDADEEQFGFEQGKVELQEFIKLANYSTHGIQDMSKKGAKTQWWEARSALDSRLEKLLANIENIWLGGFKGIFARDLPCNNPLSRFQRSFYKILDKYLPSRKRKPKGTNQNQIILDSRVLELFIGLGPPGEADDLDEPLTDLLYFVVDILQFQGEHNAYDEVDFDSVVVETLDAMTHYHEAAADTLKNATPNRTILVLDKTLHCFPWESLPCLSGQWVSRLPSLECLRVRILRQQQQQQQSIPTPDDSPDNKYCIPRTNGTYILNPSGDLTSTQSTFEAPLSALTTWSAIIKRAPSEAEITSALSTGALYLYFGHGSGGQYIRARAIKRLDHCAVALLMGCSSAALTEAGEFESYGTPLSYLQAGAQAVVGTLWDVTDKDIDRFSMKVLQRWGLFEHSAATDSDGTAKRMKTKTKARPRERAKVVEKAESMDGEKEMVGLDQAVAEGREACVLRYLNGAAPVIYGVPVFLS